MDAELFKIKVIEKSLKEWQSIDIKSRKNLITELGEMAMESTSSEGEYAGACNSAANVLNAISKYPELLDLIIEKQKKASQ